MLEEGQDFEDYFHRNQYLFSPTYCEPFSRGISDHTKVILRISQKTHVLERNCFPLSTFCDDWGMCSSGVGAPNSGEMKGGCLTLANRWLCKNELLAKLSRAPF
jgi:hypothetical protein